MRVRVCVCVCLPDCLRVCFYVGLCLFVCLSVCLCVVSVCLYVFLFQNILVVLDFNKSKFFLGTPRHRAKPYAFSLLLTVSLDFALRPPFAREKRLPLARALGFELWLVYWWVGCLVGWLAVGWRLAGWSAGRLAVVRFVLSVS